MGLLGGQVGIIFFFLRALACAFLSILIAKMMKSKNRNMNSRAIFIPHGCSPLFDRYGFI